MRRPRSAPQRWRLLAGEAPSQPKLINTCYSLVGARLRDLDRRRLSAGNGSLPDVPGAGGVSPADAPPEFRASEARYADGWFSTITAEIFG